MPVVVAFGAMILMAGLMRHTFAMADIDAMHDARSMLDRRLTWIDGGCAIPGPGAIGLVLRAVLTSSSRMERVTGPVGGATPRPPPPRQRPSAAPSRSRDGCRS